MRIGRVLSRPRRHHPKSHPHEPPSQAPVLVLEPVPALERPAGLLLMLDPHWWLAKAFSIGCLATWRCRAHGQGVTVNSRAVAGGQDRWGAYGSRPGADSGFATSLQSPPEPWQCGWRASVGVRLTELRCSA